MFAVSPRLSSASHPFLAASHKMTRICADVLLNNIETQFSKILLGLIERSFNLSFFQGMVDSGEHVTVTLKREFGEEALNSLEADENEKSELQTRIDEFFRTGFEVTAMNTFSVQVLFVDSNGRTEYQTLGYPRY